MLPLAGMLFNVVSGLVVDKAQNLAKDHVGKMLDDLLPDDAKEELDRLVADDPNHPHPVSYTHLTLQTTPYV